MHRLNQRGHSIFMRELCMLGFGHIVWFSQNFSPLTADCGRNNACRTEFSMLGRGNGRNMQWHKSWGHPQLVMSAGTVVPNLKI